MASLEHANFALATNCGMSANTTVMALCKVGDHILCVDDCYGETKGYLRDILKPNTNIELTFDDFSDVEKFKRQLRPNTRQVWLETPANPTLKVFEIRVIADICHERGILLCIDNTFMSPVNQQCLKHGADIVTQSLTKYIGGHSDLIGGSICLNDRAVYDKLHFILKTMGTGLDSFNSWLAMRSCKTLVVRVNQACANALAIAQELEASDKVEKVLYSGLKSHPQYSVARKQQTGDGAMISLFLKGGMPAAERFLHAIKLFATATSLGDCKSLVENKVIMFHEEVPESRRNLIRLSVGIETQSDLIEDIR